MSNWKGAAVLFILLRCSLAGLLDSIITPPPLVSFEKAEKVRQHFISNMEYICSFPGSILYFDSDSTCYNPTLHYIDNFSIYCSSVNDSIGDSLITDTLPVRTFRMAMSTYRRFGLPRKQNTLTYHFSHATYLKYLEEEEEVKEMPLFFKLLQRFFDFINKYILQPLYRLIVFPFEKLSFFWKSVLFTLAVAVFVLVVFVLGKFAARVYPVFDHAVGQSKDGTKIRHIDDIHWLHKARDYCSNQQTADAVECLYRYVISWFLNHNKIQRYEWWTNRQFLSILQKRYSGDFPIAEAVIDTYEQVIYGHYPVEQQQCSRLITLTERLKGKSTAP